MDVLTGVMATTQMQSETRRDAFSQMQPEARRDAFYNAVATQIAVKVMEASKAAVKAETRRVDSYDDVVEMMKEFHAAAASQAAIEVVKDTAAASQAAVEADVAFFARNKARKAFFARNKARKAFIARYKASIAAFEAEAYDDEEDEDRAAEDFEAEAYDDEEDEARAAVASQVRRYIAALEVRGVYYDIY